ncbi:hypothetical protein B0G77_6860 [Paraburkholderia sp. BL10I2N1]|nr:hypothetical protein B0G77_6860 [Paraburkholderia sp. BL10I2N1]
MGKTLLGLFLALVAVSVSFAFGLNSPDLAKSLPVAWFGLVLGPVAANFIHEGICMRAAVLQNGLDTARQHRLRRLALKIEVREQLIERLKKERDECKSKATPHDAFVTPKVEQLDNLIGDLTIEVCGLKDEIELQQQKHDHSFTVAHSS